MSYESGLIDELRERAQKAEAEVKLLRGAMLAQEDRDAAACGRLGIFPTGCDTSDMLADEVLALRAIIAEARGKLNPTIELSNASYQEGYRYAAARVLAILGEP